MSRTFTDRLHAPGLNELPRPLACWLATVIPGEPIPLLQMDCHLIYINTAPQPSPIVGMDGPTEQMRPGYEWAYQF